MGVKAMGCDFPQLLKISSGFDALFTVSDAGPVPEGRADGIAIVASDAEFSRELQSSSTSLLG